MENFFTNYEHTFSALGAIGTMLAVLTSLYFGYVALRNQYPTIVADLTEYEIIPNSMPGNPSYICLRVKNIGFVSVFLNCPPCAYKIPFINKGWVPSTLDSFNGADTNVRMKKYPYELKPRCSETFFLSTKQPFEELLEDLKKKIKPSFLIRFFKVEILSQEGKLCKVKISADLKKQIIEASKTKKIREKI